MGRATTAYLLTCAAIGVATGLLIIPATAFSTATYATLPPVSALVAGAWVIGFVVAMRLIERPGAAVLRPGAERDDHVDPQHLHRRQWQHQPEADRAQENARSLQVESNSARSDAGEARRNLSAMKSLEGVQTQLSDVRQQIGKILQPAAPTADTASPAPVVNALGQETGTLVNVTA